MRRRLDTVMTWSRSDEGRKWVRYSMVSIVSVIISQLLLAFFFGVMHRSARTSNIWAVCLSAVPSYYLNRAWAWGKRGKSHFLKEVVPFWTMALIGLALSTWAADFAETWSHTHVESHLVTTIIVNCASLGAFGVLWGVKFVILNKLMFVHHTDDLPAALDGRSGIPS
jgi:putative flippase GtrA